MATIAFLGIGMMGSQMAGRLRGAGHSVRVWNRTFEKAREWGKNGGIACETPAEAARGASSVHCMLAADDAVDETLFGRAGAAQALESHAAVVDHSTVSVRGAQDRAKRVRASGHSFIQAPVLAGPSAVGKGEGVILIGAPQSDYDPIAPLLHQIIERHWYAGSDARDSAAFKLMANLWLVHTVDALVEFFALGQACGIDPPRALTLLDAFDPAMHVHSRAPRMARGDYAPAFRLTMAAKDVKLMIEAAREGGASLPALDVIRERMLRLIKSGHGDLDLGALGLEVTDAGPRSADAAGEG